MKTRIAVLAGLLALFMTACFNFDGGDEATVTLNLSGGNTRAGGAVWPPDNTVLDDLVYTVEFSGPGKNISLEVNSGETISVTVNAGTWNIEVKAFYLEALYAVGIVKASIRPGNNLVMVPMHEGGGTGLPGNPFWVYDEFTLQKVGRGASNPEGFRDWTLDAHYIQTENITLTSDWTRIGSGAGASAFTGTYDGNGKSISNLRINDSTNYQGLFGYVGTGGEVKYLTVNVANISGGKYTGGITGFNDGTIENCNVTITGTCTADGTIGGVVGRSDGTVKNCHAIITGNVSGTSINDGNVGGVVGTSLGTMEGCSATGTGTVSCVLNTDLTMTGAGGVLGHGEVIVKNCYATVHVSGVVCIGGVAGRIANGVTLENCYATGNVTGTGTGTGTDPDKSRRIGGVVGFNDSSTVKNCCATGFVSGATATEVGGVVGQNISGRIENCYAVGNVSGAGNIGGIVGQLNNASDIVLNCYATGNVTGTNVGNSYAGGITGGNNGGSVQNCYATGEAKGVELVGGIVSGFGVNSGVLRNCVALGPKIERLPGTYTQFGRVSGNLYAATLSNNYARNNMAFVGITVSVTSSLTGIHGLNVAVDDTVSLSTLFVTNALFDPEVWDIPSGNLRVGGALPTLKNMPGPKQNPTLPAIP